MNPLDAIRDWHLTVKDAVRIAARAAHGSEDFPHLIDRRYQRFFEREATDIDEELRLGLEWVENLAVLQLVATFERVLRIHVEDLMEALPVAGQPVTQQILKVCKKQSEFWRLSDELLESFVTVDANVRGQVRQTVRFRDWVAHGWHLNTTAPVNVTPYHAYQVLSSFLQQANLIPS